MQKLILIMTAIFIVASLSACAMKDGGSMTLKCPACGHEFETTAGY